MNYADLPQSPGVYLLRHLATGDEYIGSTMSIQNRIKTHLQSMRRGVHANPLIRELCKTHGIEFTAEALEITDPKDRLRAESDWIAKRKPRLNLARVNRNKAPARIYPTRQLNIRLPAEIKKRVREFCEKVPYKPTFSQFAEAAISEWLDNHENELMPVKQ